MFPLDAENNPGQKAIDYFRKQLEIAGGSCDRRRETARARLDQQFPWIADVYYAARDKNHKSHYKAREFIRGLNYIEREFVETCSDEEVDEKEPSGPTATVEAWFKDNDVLRATFEELSHFTGYTIPAFSYPLRKMEKMGFRFVRKPDGLHVAERPETRERLMTSISDGLSRLDEGTLKKVADLINGGAQQ